jgi:hypothetical protein
MQYSIFLVEISASPTTQRAPPCIWTFLNSLAENEFFSILLEQLRA